MKSVCVSGSRIPPRDRKAPGLTASWGASRQGRSGNMRISTEDVLHAICSFAVQRNSTLARFLSQIIHGQSTQSHHIQHLRQAAAWHGSVYSVCPGKAP